MAIDDADEANGALRYITGAHKNGIAPHAITDFSQVFSVNAIGVDIAALEAAGAVASAEVGRGGVVFHHGAAMHSSLPNLTPRPRRAYAIHYVAGRFIAHSQLR
eukprot:COSAG05_NODE_9428_length_624_cov_0.809524_1_plen_104_part_00